MIKHGLQFLDSILSVSISVFKEKTSRSHNPGTTQITIDTFAYTTSPSPPMASVQSEIDNNNVTGSPASVITVSSRLWCVASVKYSRFYKPSYRLWTILDAIALVILKSGNQNNEYVDKTTKKPLCETCKHSSQTITSSSIWPLAVGRAEIV